MKVRCAILCGVLAVALLVSGCCCASSDLWDSNDTNLTEPSVEPQTETTPAPSPTPSSAPKDDASTSKKNAKVQAAMKKYLFENFGGAGNKAYATSWYSLIKKVELDDETVVVKTSIYPGSDARSPAESIASAVQGGVVAKTGEFTGSGLTAVRVLASDGQVLVSRDFSDLVR